MFKDLGFPEIALILIIIFIFFGVGKLPQVGEALGKAIHSFKKGQSGESEKAVSVPAQASGRKNSKKNVTT